MIIQPPCPKCGCEMLVRWELLTLAQMQAYRVSLCCPANHQDPPFDWFRASGEVPCTVCGQAYRRHPLAWEYLDWQGEPWLRRLCNGDLVKT